MKTNQRYTAALLAMVVGLCGLLPGCGAARSSETTADTGKTVTAPSDPAFDAKIKNATEEETVLTDNGLRLTVNGKTAEVAVYDEDTGAVWRTNPVRRTEDKTASGTNIELLNSQVAIEYVRLAENTRVSVNSDSGCLSYGRYQFYPIENGIGVRYALGEPVTVQMLPKVISVERFTQFLDKLEGEDRETLEYNYTLMSLSNYSDDGTKAALLEQYPILKKRDIYVLGGSAIGSVEIGAMLSEMLDEAFRKAGYTEKDLRFDYTDNGLTYEAEPDLTVSLSLEYRLSDGQLQVNVPRDSLTYDETLMSVSSITVLPFFGAAEKGENGDILLPDGCGAAIHFDNGKKNVPAYARKVYGDDQTYGVSNKSDAQTAQLLLPVFGMRRQQGTFLAVIDEGDAVATLHADVSEKQNDYNYVYPTFRLKEDALQSNSVLNLAGDRVYQKAPFGSDLTITYLLLRQETPSFAAMAEACRTYWIEQGLLPTGQPERTYSLYVDMLGAVDYTAMFAGIPYASLKPLTTYEEAGKIVQDLTDSGVSGLMAGYIGGLNGGYTGDAAGRVRFLRQLGGKSGWTQLQAQLTEKNIPFYPQIELRYVSNDTLFDGFRRSRDASKDLFQRYAHRRTYGLATGQPTSEGTAYIRRPALLPEAAAQLTASAQKYGLYGLEIGSLSTALDSDYNETAFTDRERAREYVRKALSRIKESGLHIAAGGANAYTLAYADVVKAVPIASGGQLLIDEDVPFLPMILHGCLPYTSTAVNDSADTVKAALKSIEYGAIPYFLVMQADNFALKGAGVPLYGINYAMWRQEMLAAAEKAAQMLDGLQGAAITAHRQVEPEVYETTYSSGDRIIVNYRTTAVTVDGVTVDAMSCERTGGAA